VPLYRCHDRFGTHFQSARFDCENAGTFESLLGYVYPEDPHNGALPIMRCIGASGIPIVSTLLPADCAPFIDQHITLGWAFVRSQLTAP
jgi:hypothetical protein